MAYNIFIQLGDANKNLDERDKEDLNVAHT